MAIFVVISQKSANAAKLPDAIAAAFPKAHRKLADNAWLVAGAGVAQDISDKLGVSDGRNGSAVITEVATYYGRATNDVWEWIKTNWEATHG